MKNIPTEMIIVHHTGGVDSDPLFDTSNQTFEVVNQYHKEKWNFKSSLGYYLGYHYFIDKAGKITQARADSDEGAHCIGHNLTSIGICLAGNFDITMPTTAQIESLKWLLNDKMETYGITPDKIYPHRTYSQKSCYGKNLSEDWARNLVKPVVEKVTVPCQAERDIIKQQEIQMGRLQSLLNWIISYL